MLPTIIKPVLRLLLWTIVIVLYSGSAFAQANRVNGIVLNDRTGEPVAGATVSVKNSNRSLATDASGRFSIEAAPADVLVISYVGYTTQEVTAGNGNLSIRMAESNAQMEEVVVIGYGVQRKKLVTGANLSVKGEDIQRQNTTTALQALQGQAAGVQITTTSGQPGSGMNVVIRGKGTTGNNAPLYIVDGVYTGDISYLNPADIQSIDVLKDAASAAIYGSQGANGVILVTTKTGRAGQKPQVTLDAFYGWQSSPRKADLLNAREYAIIMNESAINSGKSPLFTNEQIDNLPVNTNWLDEMFVENAPTQNYVLGVQGGGGSSVYSTSLGYTSQEGIVGGAGVSHFDRFTFRINSEHSIYQNKVKIGEHLTVTYQQNNGIGVGNQYNNSLRGAFNTSPFVPMYDSLGNFFDNSGSTWNNGESSPYAEMMLNNQNRNNNQRLFGDIYVSIEPIRGLRFRSSLGVNVSSSEGRSFRPTYRLSIYSFNDDTWVSQSMSRGKSLQFDNLLSYNFDVSDHSFEVLAGTSALKSNGSAIFGRNQDLVFPDLVHAWLTNATNTEGTLMTLNGQPYEETLASYFGRLQYNFNEKYLFNATFRADGSSRFAPGNRWGYFPSVSAGWVLSREHFLENISWLTFLKLRASWGRVGNQNIPNTQYLARLVSILHPIRSEMLRAY